MCEEKANCTQLKVLIRFDRLNWRGEVVTDVIERNVPYSGYDPKLFLEAVCKNDFTYVPSPVPPPTIPQYRDFMEEAFGIEFDIASRATAVESEEIGGLKFVFWRKWESPHKMHWEIAQ